MTRERELAAMLRRFQCEHRDWGICPLCATEAADAIDAPASRSDEEREDIVSDEARALLDEGYGDQETAASRSDEGRDE